jgi:predicted secreted protein
MPLLRLLPVCVALTLATSLAVPAVAAVPRDRVVRKADSGKTIDLVPGQRLVIRLSECASCGYSWPAATKPNALVLRFVSSSVVRPPGGGAGHAVGGNVTRVLVYRAGSKGATSLARIYRAPDGTTDERFELKVRVR